MAKDDALERRLPPNDPSAERAVLGCILRDNAVMDDVCRLVKASSFYSHAHRLVFDCLTELIANQRKPADPVTLADLLHERGWSADTGGPAFIVELWDSAPSTANAESYAEIVRGMAIKRAIINIGHEIEQAGLDPSMTWQETLEEAERKFFALAGRCRAVTAEPFKNAVDELLEAMDKKRSEEGAGLMKLGLRTVDAITDGLSAGSLIVIAARTGVGKTVIALNLAFNLAEEGTPSLFFSLEQPRVELAERILSNKSGVEAFQIRSAKIPNPNDEERFFQAIAAVNKLPVYISDTPRQTAFEITGTIRHMVAKHKVGAAFIDYLNLMEPDNKRLPRHEQLSEICRQMKLVARETGIRLFLLAQISREAEKSADKRPSIHHLKESGAIEENSDVILLLHCEVGTGTDIECIVAKNRHGLKGVAHLHFDRPRLRILDKI